MNRTICRLPLLVAVFAIVFFPCCGERSYRPGITLLRPLPPPSLQPEITLLRPLPPPPAGGFLPCDAFGKAVHFLRTHWSRFSNRRFITIIDYTEPSTSKRLFLIDLESGVVKRFLVSHGKNSGKLYATRFSNRADSYESPLGFFLTGREYHGSHGPSLVLYGLQKGINDNSAARKIVIHGAYYVCGGAVKLNRRLHGLARLGLSLGCPAIPMKAAGAVINKIKDGSLLYVYAASENGEE